MWEAARLEGAYELTLFNMYFFCLPNEDRKSVEVMEQFGIQNNFSTITWMLLGNSAVEAADNPGTSLSIGILEPVVSKVRKQMVCRFHTGLGTVTLQVFAAEISEVDT